MMSLSGFVALIWVSGHRPAVCVYREGLVILKSDQTLTSRQEGIQAQGKNTALFMDLFV